jgi:hypothetical protein
MAHGFRDETKSAEPTPNKVEPAIPVKGDRETILGLLHSLIKETQNPNGQLEPYYANFVDYYKTKQYAKNKILDDKKKIFQTLSNFVISISNIKQEQIDTLNWKCSYEKTYSSYNIKKNRPFNGRVNSVLVFTKIDGKWLVTTEKDE